MLSRFRNAGFLAVFFTLILSVSSWAADSPAAVTMLGLHMGSENDAAFSFTVSGYVTDINDKNNSKSNAVDLEAYHGTRSGDGYLYMAFTTNLNYNHYKGTDFGSDQRPITDIIVVDFYGHSASNIAYEYDGRIYHRLKIWDSKSKDYPMNRTNDTENHHLYLLYTRDYMDGYVITDIRASTSKKDEEPSTKDGYSVVLDGNGKAADLNVETASNYLYVKKEKIPDNYITQYRDALVYPYVRSSVVYDPWMQDFVYTGVGLYGDACSSKIKIGNKFVGDSIVTDDRGYDLKWGSSVEAHLKPDKYKVYTRLECGSSLYARVTYLGETNIQKITSADYNKKIDDYFFYDNLLYDRVYSGQTAPGFRFADLCMSHDDFLSYASSSVRVPSSVTLKYSSSKNGPYYSFSPTSKKWITSGTYYIKAYRPANDYCEAIETDPITLNVYKSQLVIVFGNGTPNHVIEGEEGDAINYTLPTSLTREGYTFSGWEGSVPSKMPSGVTTITAKWIANSYMFYLNRNDDIHPVYQTKSYTSSCPEGTDNESCYSEKLASRWLSSKIDYGTKLSYPTWYKVGYKHTGWTLSDGTTDYKPATMPAKNVDVYAKWTPIDFTMTFNTNGGSEVASITQGYETTIAKPADPTKEGYDFAGWDPEIPSKMPYGNTTYTAKWSQKTYHVYFKDGYSESDINKVDVPYGTSLADVAYPADPTREGYTFTGWDLASLPETMPAENITVTAQWDVNYYKVTIPAQLQVVRANGCKKAVKDQAECAYGSVIVVSIRNNYNVLGNLFYTGTEPWTTLEIVSNNVWSFSVAAKDGEVKGRIVKDYGTIQIAVDGSEAIIDDSKASETGKILNPIEVDSVTFAREFTKNYAEVVMLPFDISLRKVRGGVFCKFMGMDKSGFSYTARLMFVSTTLSANTPYLFVPTSKKMLFKLPQGEKIAIQTSETPENRQGDWVLRGNYDLIDWENSNIEGAYVFNASASTDDGVNGSFKKATSGTLQPLSGYLVKEAQAAAGARGINGKVAPKTMSIEQLPDEIYIRIETENGQTTALGKMNTATGEIKLDRWFDAQGRLLKGKPTIEGIYYNNGKKVIVK